MDYSLVTTYKTNKVCYLILPEGVSKDFELVGYDPHPHIKGEVSV